MARSVVNDRIRLTRYDLQGTPSSAVPISLKAKIAALDHMLAVDFGVQGIGGNQNSTVGDGYYFLEFDLDGDGSFESDRRFYRLLGDITGDRQVSDADIVAIDQALNQPVYNPERDVNGDGALNSYDRTLISRSKGRKLGTGLRIDR